MKKSSGMQIIVFLLIQLPPLISCLYPNICNEPSECTPNEACVEGQCICDLDRGFHHEEACGKCVKLAGKSCQEEEQGKIPDCLENGHCHPQSKTCVCNENYDQTKFDECKKSYGAPCNQSEECNDAAFLICDKSQKSCRCLDPVQMIYDSSLKTCVSKLGGECEFKEFMFIKRDCIQNADCVEIPGEFSDFIGICECKTGFTNISALLCLKLYQEQCDKDSDCVTGFCSPSNNKCDCPFNSILGQDLETCLLNVGEICQPGQLTLACVPNATCSSLTSRCQCFENFSPHDGLCEPSVERTSTTTLLSATDASQSIYKIRENLLRPLILPFAISIFSLFSLTLH